MELYKIIEIFVAFFIIVDPVGVIPIFIAITSGASKRLKKIIAYRALVFSIFIVFLFALFGKYILEFLGIDLNAFQVAGGILLAILAYNMLNAHETDIKTTKEEREEIREKLIEEQALWVVPLAIPTLAGPATMSSIIIFISNSQSVLEKVVVVLSVIISLIIAYYFMIFSDKILNRLGTSGINATTRILGIILLSISVKMIIIGIKNLWYK
ncbi:MAG: MarC family protein [bacterium]|nr:MarC family protein [bacterium]